MILSMELFHSKKVERKALVPQSCLTLCNLVDCSSPDSSVHGILQARILEWVAISFSRGSNPSLLHFRQILYPLSHGLYHAEQWKVERISRKIRNKTFQVELVNLTITCALFISAVVLLKVLFKLKCTYKSLECLVKMQILI